MKKLEYFAIYELSKCSVYKLYKSKNETFHVQVDQLLEMTIFANR
jgi:hypothetical protein